MSTMQISRSRRHVRATRLPQAEQVAKQRGGFRAPIRGMKPPYPAPSDSYWTNDRTFGWKLHKKIVAAVPPTSVVTLSLPVQPIPVRALSKSRTFKFWGVHAQKTPTVLPKPTAASPTTNVVTAPSADTQQPVPIEAQEDNTWLYIGGAVGILGLFLILR